MSYRPLTSVTGAEADVLSSDVPMQVQIYRQLRTEIEDGLWIGRGDFPGEKDVAERFGVSVITSRAALARLAREGLVDRGRGRRGRATFVPEPKDPEPLDLFPDDNAPYRFRLIGAGVDVAPAPACVAFGLPPGSELWQAIRVVTVHGKVHSVTHNAQLPELGLRHRKRDLNKRPMVAILRSEGVHVAKVRRHIQAATPPPVAARYLGLNLDSPVLMVILRLEDEEQRTVEWMRAFGHPDRALTEEVMDVGTGSWRRSG